MEKPESQPIRCRIVKTPRPAFPWKIETLAPHVVDNQLNYHFRTQEDALAAVRERNWEIAKPVSSFKLLPLLGEFGLITALLLPLVFLVAKNSSLSEIVNPYTTVVLSVMIASFIYPAIKLIRLLVVKVDTLSDLIPLGVYLFLAIGFLYFFLAMFSQKPPRISRDPDRKSQYANLSPGQNASVYDDFSKAAAEGKDDPDAPINRRILFYANRLWLN